MPGMEAFVVLDVVNRVVSLIITDIRRQKMDDVVFTDGETDIDLPQSLTISWAQMDDNASAHPANSHGAARNPNPDSFVPINPLEASASAVLH